MEESETEARPEGIENDMGASNFASEAKPSFVIQSKNPSSEKCYYEILGLQQNVKSAPQCRAECTNFSFIFITTLY